MVCSRAIVCNMFDSHERVAVNAYLSCSIAALLMLSSLVTSLVLDTVHWCLVFGLLGAYVAVLLIVVGWSLPESLPPVNLLLAPNSLPSSYLAVLRACQFLFFNMIICTTHAVIFCCIMWSGLLQWGYPARLPRLKCISRFFECLAYPWFILGRLYALQTGFARPPSGGSFVYYWRKCWAVHNTKLLNHSLPIQMVFVFLSTFGVGIALPQAIMNAVGPFKLLAATARAVNGFFQMTIAAFLSLMSDLLSNSHVTHFGTLILACAIIALAVLFVHTPISRILGSP